MDVHQNSQNDLKVAVEAWYKLNKGDVRATAMANAASNGLAGDPKWFSHCVVMLNTCVPSRGSKEERIRIPLLAVPNIYSK